MSKIARVKFIRDKEPNIKALTAENKVLDGALYVATDTGTMWMGTSATSLIQIKDNINTNTTYTLTKNGNTITLKGSDGSSVNITDSNTIYNNATASAAGLMSAADKSKLDSVATGANKTVVDASFVADSTNPVQSKVVKSALDGKVDKTGDIMTGRLTVPEVAATDYFFTPTMVGEGDKTKYYHRVDFGYAGHDYVDFHEFGGTWNFYQNQGGTEDSKILVGSIKPDGFHGNLKGQADSVPWSGITGKPSFATVATSGSYNDLSNKPTIPTVPSSLKNPNALTISLNGTSQGAYDGSAVKNINITASSIGAAASSHTHTKSQISDFPSKLEPYFANDTWYVVGDDAAIGDHNKGGAFCVKGLNGTPNISLYNSDDSYYGQCITTADIGSQSVSYANTAGSVAWTNVSGRPSSMPASDVYAWAKASSKPSYSWSEISNRPSIPSVGNGTVTIKQNGATKGSFTLNQSGNATIELTDNDTNTWRPEEVIISSTQPSASTCKLWIKI